jgi:hypothetical protein
MDKPKKYATAMAFRRALEDRLKRIAGKEGLPSRSPQTTWVLCSASGP